MSSLSFEGDASLWIVANSERFQNDLHEPSVRRQRSHTRIRATGDPFPAKTAPLPPLAKAKAPKPILSTLPGLEEGNGADAAEVGSSSGGARSFSSSASPHTESAGLKGESDEGSDKDKGGKEGDGKDFAEDGKTKTEAEGNGKDSAAKSKRTRNRPTLSCTECKARKIKCDRLYPCTSCKQRGIAEKCRWEEGKGKIQAERASAMANELASLRIRVGDLEAELNAERARMAALLGGYPPLSMPGSSSLACPPPSASNTSMSTLSDTTLASPSVASHPYSFGFTSDDSPSSARFPRPFAPYNASQGLPQLPWSMSTAEAPSYADGLGVGRGGRYADGMRLANPWILKKEARADDDSGSSDNEGDFAMALDAMTIGRRTGFDGRLRKGSSRTNLKCMQIASNIRDDTSSLAAPMERSPISESGSATAADSQPLANLFLCPLPLVDDGTPLRQLLATLPPKHECDFLIDRFCHILGLLLHIIHIPSFRKRYDEFWTVFSRKSTSYLEVDPCFLAQIFLGLALGAYFTVPADADALAGLRAASGGAGPGEGPDMGQLSRTWFIAGQRALWRSNPFVTNGLDTVKAICFSIQWLQNQAGGEEAQLLLALGIRICIQNGFHRLPPMSRQGRYEKQLVGHSNRQLSFIEVEEARRAWWRLVLSDWYTASKSADATYLVHDIFSTDPPANLSDSDFVEGQPSPQTGHPREVPTELCLDTFVSIPTVQVVRRFNDIMKANYGKAAPPYHLIQETDAEMRRIIDETPACLRLDQPPAEAEQAIRQQPMLKLWKCHAAVFTRYVLIKIHRPYLARSYRDARYRQSKETCVESARVIIRAMKTTRTAAGEDRPERKWWLSHLYLFSATSTLILDLLHADESIHAGEDHVQPTRETEERILECREAVYELSLVRDSKVARNGAQVLQGMLEELISRKKGGVKRRMRTEAGEDVEEESRMARMREQLLRGTYAPHLVTEQQQAEAVSVFDVAAGGAAAAGHNPFGGEGDGSSGGETIKTEALSVPASWWHLESVIQGPSSPAIPLEPAAFMGSASVQPRQMQPMPQLPPPPVSSAGPTSSDPGAHQGYVSSAADAGQPLQVPASQQQPPPPGAIHVPAHTHPFGAAPSSHPHRQAFSSQVILESQRHALAGRQHGLSVPPGPPTQGAGPPLNENACSAHMHPPYSLVASDHHHTTNDGGLGGHGGGTAGPGPANDVEFWSLLSSIRDDSSAEVMSMGGHVHGHGHGEGGGSYAPLSGHAHGQGHGQGALSLPPTAVSSALNGGGQVFGAL